MTRKGLRSVKRGADGALLGLFSSSRAEQVAVKQIDWDKSSSGEQVGSGGMDTDGHPM